MTKSEITCALTGMKGHAVKSHLIPKAFTRRLGSSPFVEYDSNADFTKRRFTSWYDPNLLIRTGEDILGELDDYAAKVFFERGLTYRKRRNAAARLSILGGFQSNTVVKLQDVDAAKLRRFGQSLLWRFAVSSQEVANTVEVSASDLRRLRALILGKSPDAEGEYPVYFSVASDGEELAKIGPWKMGGHPFYRFFLDGVVCYASPFRRNTKFESYSSLFASDSNELFLWCFDAESSEQIDLENVLAKEMKSRFGDPFG